MKEVRKDLKLTNKVTDNRFSDEILRNEQESLNSDQRKINNLIISNRGKSRVENDK
jgi:hypothetical protein